MQDNLLILSHPVDTHAVAVAEALKVKGATPVLWQTTDFPSLGAESIFITSSGSRSKVAGPDLALEENSVRTVWHRRPLTEPDLTIIDSVDHRFTVQQCESFRRGLFRLLAPEAFWVNPAAASSLASNKIVQQATAVGCGLEVPNTLYSNDPEEIRDFLGTAKEGVIFKILTGAPWSDGETRWMCYATAITADHLVDPEILRQTPSIYQSLVPKAYELRITIMGRQVFAAKIFSQDTEHGKTDWRKAYRELRMQPAAVSGEVAEKCFSLMNRLSIVFGCFDFIVTPDGRSIFLEVNEMGQFLFVEEYTSLPLLDAFSDFLIAADPLFEYRPKSSVVHFAQLSERIAEAVESACSSHVQASAQDYIETGHPRG